MEAQLSGQALRAAYHMPWPHTKTALTCKPLLAQFGTHACLELIRFSRAQGFFSSLFLYRLMRTSFYTMPATTGKSSSPVIQQSRPSSWL
jgi:hypothetical protein